VIAYLFLASGRHAACIATYLKEIDEQTEYPKMSTKSDADAEASLLAEAIAIGNVGTLHDSTAYESQVLRHATASSSDIPQLSGIGFPNLSALAPSSYGANNENHNHNHTNNQNNKRRKIDKSDISHMLTVLRSVKTQLDEMNSTSNHAKAEGRSSQILRLQYQMLLTHLASMQVEKELVLPHVKSEHRSEERRRDYLRKSAHKAMQKGGMEMEVEDSDRVTGRRVSLQATRDGANRLEQIKRGAIQSQSQSSQSQSQSLPSHDQNSTDAVNIMSTSSTASFGFGKQALNDKNAHRKRSSKKLSMMGMGMDET